MRRSRGRPKTTDTSVSIPVSSLSPGAQAADAFSGWSSPATSVFSRTDYGTTAKYIYSADATKMMATTKGLSRDQEVTFFTAGYSSVYLRWTPGGKAIHFAVNPDYPGYSLAILNDVAEGAFKNSGGLQGVDFTSVARLFTLPDIEDVPGWSNTSTAGHTWTVGVEGFDIYLKYNGVEFYRVAQFFLLTPGKIALHSNVAPDTYGFRDVTATHKISKVLHSNLSHPPLIDVRDLGFKSDVETTGNMTAGEYVVSVASAAGFSVGRRVCIATGGEVGGGVPGERGVGGQWPTLLYANTTARDADTGQVTNKVCGVLADGSTYQWNGSAWVPYSPALFRYLNKILPRALSAKITAIAGNVLTLDTAAIVSVTGAKVYLDNADLVTAYFTDTSVSGLVHQPGATVYVTEGRWVATGSRFTFGDVTEVTMKGDGPDASVFISPTGSREPSVLFTVTTDCVVEDLGIEGNTREDKGYMFLFDPANDTNIGSTTFFKSLVCTGNVHRNIRGKNYSNAVSELAYCTDCLQTGIEVEHETAHKNYFQWAVNISDSTDCITDGVAFDSPYLIKGLESFRSTGSILRNVTGRNAVFSSNSNGSPTFQNCKIIYEPGCGDAPWNVGQPFGSMMPAATEPLLNLNSNIDNTSGSGTGTGILVENCDFDVQGVVWTGTGVAVISISGTVDDVVIRGKYKDKPVSAPSGRIQLPSVPGERVWAVRNDDDTKTITVEGMRLETGTDWTVVGNFGGTLATGTTVRNCVVDTLGTGGTQTGNISNAAYEAL